MTGFKVFESAAKILYFVIGNRYLYDIYRILLSTVEEDIEPNFACTHSRDATAPVFRLTSVWRAAKSNARHVTRC